MRVQSLDDVYYFGGQQAWHQVAIVPDKESGLSAGDLVSYHGNHWNGYAKITAQHAHGAQIRPAYKFESRLLKTPFGPQINASALFTP